MNAQIRQNLLTGTSVLVILGLGSLVQKRLPSPTEVRARPFVHLASIGSLVHLRSGDVRVLDVKASSNLKSDTDTRAVASQDGGIFLLVDLEFTATREPGDLEQISVQSLDGRQFARGVPVGASACVGGQPGIPVRCEIVVEMAKNALRGAQLRITADEETDGSGDDVGVIDLQIDQQRATALSRQTAPYLVSLSTKLAEP